MPDALDTLAQLHGLIGRCRRMAIDVADRDTANVLSKLADDLEQYVRRATFGALNAVRRDSTPSGSKLQS